jgi:hypothetical protein
MSIEDQPKSVETPRWGVYRLRAINGPWQPQRPTGALLHGNGGCPAERMQRPTGALHMEMGVVLLNACNASPGRCYSY